MENLLTEWIVESSISLLLLYLLYGILFKKDSFYQLKRVYLIGSGVFAAIIPLIQFQFAQASIPQFLLEPVTSLSVGTKAIQGPASLPLLPLLYFCGVGIALCILLYKLYKLVQILRQPGDYPELSYSFFNIIKTPERADERERQLIYHHEMVHSKQWHSLDLLLVEFLKVIMWFNPFIYLLGRDLKFVHENIADTQTAAEFGDYKMVLLNQKLNTGYFSMAHEFNSKANFKNRLKMMTKTSNKSALIKYFSIPLLVSALFLTFCNKPQMNQQGIVKKVDEQPQYEGGQEALFQELSQKFKYPEELKEKQEEGKVFVGLIIDEKGELVETKVLNSTNDKFNDHAIQVVKSLEGTWSPATKDGNAVKAQMVLPVRYELK